MTGDGYFLRLSPTAAATQVDDPRHSVAPSKHRRRSSVRPVPLVLFLALLGLLAWAALTPGGIQGKVEDGVDRVKELVQGATADPGLKRAETYFTTRYNNGGQYPQMSETALRADDAADWGVGVEVEWCNPQVIVLRALSGNGTTSRLLVAGESWGDAVGDYHCPQDLGNPAPWKIPEALSSGG